VKKIDVERHVRDAERGMNLRRSLALDDFGSALRVLDVHPKQHLHDEVECPAGELALACLHLVQHRPRNPARTDNAIRLARPPHQIGEGCRAGRPVGVHIPDQVRQRREPQSLNQRAAFPDGILEHDRADLRKFGGDLLHHRQCVVPAPV